MPAVPLGIQSYERKRSTQPETRLVNLYIEEDKSGASPDQAMRLQRPGLVKLHAIEGKPIRGLYQSDGVLSNRLVIVAGGTLYLSDGANLEDKGTLPDDLDTVRIAATFERIGICTAGQFWLYDGTTLARIELPDNRAVIDVDVINSYFVCITAPGQFYWLAPGASTFDALDFATAEALPDGLRAARRIRDDVFLFGSQSIEVWQSTGDANSLYQRAPGRLIDRGVQARETVVAFDNSVVFVGDDGLVYRLSDVPKRISNNGIEERIAERSDLCSAFSFTSEGHLFYVLTIPGVGTYAYDASTEIWSEFASHDSVVFIGRHGFDSALGSVCGDLAGNVYRFDRNATTDDGAPILKLVSGTIATGARPIANQSFSTHIGLSGPATIRLRWIDARSDWSKPRSQTVREGSEIVDFYRLGVSRGAYRHYELSCLDPVLMRVSGAFANEGWTI
ncbi:packaged DNA stabilization protein gp10 [Sphingomonas sp. S1-29]|uniref:hypothetical protein n=1 Tax=Sphingomonas sp. S1-29 TaxID=2991074 RepID=UPI0022402228|nr:hypothetical protein [Sphingomonas sp. S1-29]UZK69599.1 packaged DNA stabilization protein gp10 [Sphingomonas sp. S1-29]